MAKLRPLRGYVLIEPIKDDEKTSVGVYLPETAKDKPMKGKVLYSGEPSFEAIEKIGEVRANLETEAFKDETVYYKRWANDEIKEDGKDYVFVKYSDLLGVLKD